MKICLVTAFPPSRRGLNEYGFHIARELQRDPLLSVTVLSDALETDEPENPDFSVEQWAAVQPDKYAEDAAHFAEGLRKAGLN